MEEKKIFIPELNIECAYTIGGEGPNVILLHGLCESKKVWQNHAKLLSSEYRVLVPDLPGYGDSQPFSDGDFSLERMQKAVFAIADAEQFDRFSIVGHSMGGYTALAMLETQIKRIKGLSLFHSTSHADSDEKKKGRDKSIKVLQQNRDLFFREVFKNLFNSEKLTEYMPLVLAMYQDSAQIETETVTGTLLALRDRKDRFDLLNNFYGHISYFIGEKDNVLPVDDLVEEAEKLVVEFYVSEDSGHMGFYEVPDEVTEYLFNFLEETEEIDFQ
jgi:pimeloyl-ACP methyl ester carboxylesterase